MEGAEAKKQCQRRQYNLDLVERMSNVSPSKCPIHLRSEYGRKEIGTILG